MSQRSKARKAKAQIREHAHMAELLLPPTPENCPRYTRKYFERFSSRLFFACRNGHHRNCPKTSVDNGGRDHWYCKCPCHLPKLSRYQKRKMWLALKQEQAKAERKRGPRVARDPNAVRVTIGTKGQKKMFRYLKAPADKIPAGIMHIVHEAISTLKQGTVAEVAKDAIARGLTKVTGQDPTNQTSVMLHRMLKAGVVEVL